jgi:YD repeat-containing protein
VTETSAGQTRTTSTAWREPDAARFVVGLPLEQHVQVGTEHWQRHWFYTDIGFLEKAWDWFRVPEAAGHETTYAPDAYGNVASVTKGNNKTTTFSYAWGVVKNTTTPEYTVSREINPDGTVASETRAGRTTTFQYDPLERYFTQTQPPGGPSQSNPIVVTVDPDRQWMRTSRFGPGGLSFPNIDFWLLSMMAAQVYQPKAEVATETTFSPCQEGRAGCSGGGGK